MPELKLTEIAPRIRDHLHRFEHDPEINVDLKPPRGVRRYFHAVAYAHGRWVRVTYISYQGGSNLTKAEALAYLSWLDAGNVGTHRDAGIAAPKLGRR